MGIRSLVSFGLLAVPVAVTVGVLVGIDAYRTSNGMQKIFVDNRVTNKTYCQKAYGIHPTSTGQQYTCKSSSIPIKALQGTTITAFLKDKLRGWLF